MREMGSGPPVLVLHGNGAPAAALEPLASALADRWRVLLPDLPGYGGSSPVENANLARAQELLVSALRERGVGRLSVIAHSLGGYRAMRLALSAELQIERLFLLGPWAYLPEADKEALEGLAVAVTSGADLSEAVATRWAAPAYLRANPGLVDEIRGWLAQAPVACLAEEVRAIIRAPDLRPRLAGLSVPTFLRVGALDQATPPALAREIQARVPGARLEVVEGAGHLLVQEDGPATLAAVRAALSEPVVP